MFMVTFIPNLKEGVFPLQNMDKSGTPPDGIEKNFVGDRDSADYCFEWSMVRVGTHIEGDGITYGVYYNLGNDINSLDLP